MPDQSPYQTMPDRRTADLPALIGSRICHDLISPIGAIGNGVELLGMAANAPRPELELISDSVASANARIKFFRIAFGSATAEQRLGRPEAVQTLEEFTRGGRLSVDWRVESDTQRGEAKMAFLAILCLETALAYGGKITVSLTGRSWKTVGAGTKTKIDPVLWLSLTDASVAVDYTPAQVQFASLPEEVAKRDRSLATEIHDTKVAIQF